MASANRKSLTQDLRQDYRAAYRDLCCCLIKEKLFLGCVPVVLTILMILLLILQSVGSFKKEWVIFKNSTEEITGVDFNSNTVEGLEIAVFGVLIILLIGISVVYLCLCSGRDIDRKAVNRVCFITIVPAINFVLGLIGIAGCIMVALSELENGTSFYLCLTTSIIQLVYPPILFLFFINQRNNCLCWTTDDDGPNEEYDQRPEEYVMDGGRHYGSEECY